MSEIFLKLNLLNKNFYQILEKLKKFPKLWKIKFLQEFISNKDKKDKLYVNQDDQDRYYNVFRDHQKQEDESTFSFYKRSIEK